MAIPIKKKISDTCEPEEGWYGQPKYCVKNQVNTRCYQLCGSIWTSRFLFLIFKLIRSLF